MVTTMQQQLQQIDGLIDDLTTATERAGQAIRRLRRFREKTSLAEDEEVIRTALAQRTDHVRIARIVAAKTGISWRRICGRTRPSEVVAARWLAIQMLDSCGYSASAIGRLIDKDHSSVLHALQNWPAIYSDPANAKFSKTAYSCWHQFYRERL